MQLQDHVPQPITPVPLQEKPALHSQMLKPAPTQPAKAYAILADAASSAGSIRAGNTIAAHYPERPLVLQPQQQQQQSESAPSYRPHLLRRQCQFAQQQQKPQRNFGPAGVHVAEHASATQVQQPLSDKQLADRRQPDVHYGRNHHQQQHQHSLGRNNGTGRFMGGQSPRQQPAARPRLPAGMLGSGLFVSAEKSPNKLHSDVSSSSSRGADSGGKRNFSSPKSILTAGGPCGVFGSPIDNGSQWGSGPTGEAPSGQLSPSRLRLLSGLSRGIYSMLNSSGSRGAGGGPVHQHRQRALPPEQPVMQQPRLDSFGSAPAFNWQPVANGFSGAGSLAMLDNFLVIYSESRVTRSQSNALLPCAMGQALLRPEQLHKVGRQQRGCWASY